MSLRLIADVHISPLTVTALQPQNYDVVRVTDVLPATATDAEILNFARMEARIVLTQDLDFSALVALGGYSRPSLITLRLSSAQPQFVSQKLLEVLPQLEQALTDGVAVTIADDSVRVRPLPIQ